MSTSNYARNMRASTRIAVAFGKGAILLVLLASAWGFLAPSYNLAMASVASQLTPREVSVSLASASIRLEYRSSQLADPVSAEGHGFTLHWGLILVASVIALTPGMRIRRRILALAIAFAMFLLMHVLTIVCMGWAIKWAVEGGPWTLAAEYFLPAFSISWTLFPALLAGAWCFLYWRPALFKA